MRYAATLNATIALMAMLASIYHHDLGSAGAWASAMLGWGIVAGKAWSEYA